MKEIRISALDSNNQLCRLSLIERGVEPNGLQMDLKIEMTGFSASVSTFFFGYNLANFSAELELLEVGERQTANLFNFDESLIMSVSQTTEAPPLRYAFLSYRVPNPRYPASGEVPIDVSVTKVGSDGGTNVSVAFLRIHEHADEIAKLLDQFISEAGMG